MNKEAGQDYLPEKRSVLGELSGRMRQAGLNSYKDRRDDEEFPPPPPVFQTYAAQLSGKGDEDDLPPPPTPLQSGQCYGCSEEVQSGGCTANGRTFHKECFKCSNCKKMLEEKFFTAEAEPLCENCYKVEDKTCDVCSRAIAGDCLMSKGKHFHQDCMKCSVCGEVLSGTYFTAMDKLICEKDYKETAKSCSDCGCEISGAYYTLDNEKVVCEADYKKMLGNCERCGKIVEGKILKVSGGFYHPDCFSCVVCKESLVGVPFSLDDDKLVYCSEDYKKKHAAQCSACRQPIVPAKGETSAPRLRALGRDFHPECFKCEDCGLVLDSRISGSECYPVDNKPLCAACCRKRQQ